MHGFYKTLPPEPSPEESNNNAGAGAHPRTGQHSPQLDEDDFFDDITRWFVPAIGAILGNNSKRKTDKINLSSFRHFLGLLDHRSVPNDVLYSFINVLYHWCFRRFHNNEPSLTCFTISSPFQTAAILESWIYRLPTVLHLIFLEWKSNR